MGNRFGIFVSLTCGLAAGLLSQTQTVGTQGAAGAEPAWTSLFNGKDLAGWDTWLGRPHKSVVGLDVKKNDQGDYTESVGLNKDPKKVYAVVQLADGPAIRISGEIFGALTTKEEFDNYHLRLDFKWGEKKWAPRENAVRDSGILYHCVGAHGVAGSYWMQSQECQVQERDCGDYWSVAGAIIDIEAVQTKDDAVSPLRYQPGAAKQPIPRQVKLPNGTTRTDNRVIKGADFERKSGEWNTVEVHCLGGTSVHTVNGQVVMILTGSRRREGDKEVPLTKGKIQIQSEGAEVFYRNLQIRPIKELPEARKPG